MAAVTKDAAASASGGLPLSWSHTISEGNNGLLVVAVSCHAAMSVSGVTYGGVALTQALSYNANFRRIYVYYLVAPEVGTATVAVSGSGSSVVAGSLSFFNVDQSAPLWFSSSGFGASPITQTIVAPDDAIALDVVSSYATTLSAAVGQDVQWAVRHGTEQYGGCSLKSGANYLTLSWTYTGDGNAAQTIVVINPLEQRIVYDSFSGDDWPIAYVALPGEGQAGPQIDNISHNRTTANTLSWSHFISGNNRLLILAIGMHSGDSLTYARCNGSDMSLLGTVSGNWRKAYIYYVTNPPTGPVTIALAKTGTNAYPSAMAVSLTGVDQDTPFVDNDGQTGGTSPMSIPTMSGEASDLAVGVVAIINTSAITPNGGCIAEIPGGSDIVHAMLSQLRLSGDTVDMSWTVASGDKSNAVYGCVIKGIAGGTTYEETLSESFSADDAGAAQGDYNSLSLPESFSAGDEVAALPIEAEIAESLSLDDAPAVETETALLESFTVDDAQAAAAEIPLALDESFSADDAPALEAEKPVALSESFSASDLPVGEEYYLDTYTKLLLHCDGPDGSQTFVDSSFFAHTATLQVGQDVEIDTAQSKFGGASGLFNSEGNWADHLIVAASDDWAFGTGDFTIDLWVRFSHLPAPGDNQHPAGVLYHPNCLIRLSTEGYSPYGYYWVVSVGATQINTEYIAITTNTWHHLAVIRHDGSLRFFVDGQVMREKYTGLTEKPCTSDLTSTSPLLVGYGEGTTWTNFRGWMDEIRVSKGIARWWSDFPLPTEAYAGAPSTLSDTLDVDDEVLAVWADYENPGIDHHALLMLHGNGTDGSTVFTDSSPFGRSVGHTGAVSLDTAQKVFGSASIEFGGGYLTVPDSDDWNFDVAGGTIDFRVRFTSLSQVPRVLVSHASLSAEYQYRWDVRVTDSRWDVAIWGDSSINPWFWDDKIKTDRWYHIAVVFEKVDTGLLVRLFRDGAELTPVGSALYAGTFPQGTRPLLIGCAEVYDIQWEQFGFIAGWIDEFRISNVVRWTRDFDVPAAEYTAGTYTVFDRVDDGFGLADDIAGAVQNIIQEEVTESLGLDDDAAPAASEWPRLVDDSFTVDDAVAAAHTLGTAADDSLSLDDVLLCDDAEKALPESFALLDTVDVEEEGEVHESFRLDDAFDAALFTAWISDDVALDDTFLARLTAEVLEDESFSFADSIGAGVVIEDTLADHAAFDDVLEAERAATGELWEQIGLDDEMTALSSAPVEAVLAESFAMSGQAGESIDYESDVALELDAAGSGLTGQVGTGAAQLALAARGSITNLHHRGACELPGLAATGTCKVGRVAVGNVVFPGFACSGQGYVGNKGAGHVEIELLGSGEEGRDGAVCNGAIVLPGLEIVAHGFANRRKAA
jgi:hypothetical protein